MKSQTLQSLLLVAIIAAISSCTIPRKVECPNVRYIPVIIEQPNGTLQTIQVPWCDTIKLKKKEAKMGDAAGIIAAAAPIADTALNIAATSLSGRRNRKFAREMYWRQREDALADWNMQNEYNSPAAQMARLKEAGLNPHMVYGAGGSIMQSTAARASNAPGASEQITPGARLGDAMSQMYNIKLMKANLDNVKAQTEVARTVAANNILMGTKTTAETMNLLTMGKHSKFDLARKEELKQVIFEKGVADLDMVKANIDATVHGNIRAEEAFQLEQKGRAQALTAQQLDIERKKLDNRMQAMQNGQFELMRPIELARAQATLDQLRAQIQATKMSTMNEEQIYKLNKMDADAGKLIRYLREIIGTGKEIRGH